MIMVKVTKEFHDKDNYAIVYKVGDSIKIDNNRAEKLITLGIAEPMRTLKKKVEK